MREKRKERLRARIEEIVGKNERGKKRREKNKHIRKKKSDVRRALISKQPMIILMYKEALLNTNTDNSSLPSVVMSLLQEYTDLFPKELPQRLPPI